MKMNATLLLICAIASAGISGCGSSVPRTATEVETQPVSVIKVAEKTVAQTSEVVGTVRAAQVAQLSSQVMARIVSVRVREGDHVRRGQVLFSLDPASSSAAATREQAALAGARQQYLGAQADDELAQSTLQRYKRLELSKSVSPHEMEEVSARAASAAARLAAARAAVQQAEAGQKEAQIQMGFTSVRAPFDGVVTARFADIGSMASPGQPILQVEDGSRFQLEISVDEADAGAIALGGKIEVSIDSLPEKTITASVARIVPVADPASRTVLVKLDLPRLTGIRSGVFGRAMLPRGEQQALLVPATAVQQRGQTQFVYVVPEDRVAVLRFVTTSEHSGGFFMIRSGLRRGEQIVADPGGRDLAGSKVEVR